MTQSLILSTVKKLLQSFRVKYHQNARTFPPTSRVESLPSTLPHTCQLTAESHGQPSVTIRKVSQRSASLARAVRSSTAPRVSA